MGGVARLSLTRMDRRKTRIEEEECAIYRVGRCGAEMYDWLPTPFIFFLLGVDDEKVELSFGK